MNQPKRAMTPAQAGALLKRRREKDPCYAYEPNATQDEFHKSLAYFRLITGGNRSGKTTSGLIELAWLARGIHPHRKSYGPIVAMVFCISRQQAAMVAQRKLFEQCEFPGEIGKHPLIPKREIKEVGSVKVGFRTIYQVVLNNGSVINFSWSDVDDVWKRIQGAGVDVIYIDENAGSDKLLIECYGRLMATQGDPRKKPWGGCLIWGATGTEINEGFEKFRRRCLDPTDIDHAVFQIKPGENRAITQEALDRFSNVLTEEERRVRITGEATAADLVQIFGKQWDDKRHILPVDYLPSDYDNLWLSYDPGVDHPTGMLISAIRKDEPRTLYCVRFWNHSRQTLDYDLACLEHYLCGRRLAGVVYDAQASAQSKRDGGSLLNDIIKKLQEKGMSPLVGYFKSVKNHYAGISQVRHYLDPDPYDKSVLPLIRLNPSVESGCQLLRYQLVKYMGKEATRFTGEGGVVKKEDEGPDCIRYQTMKRAAYNAEWACGAMTKEALAENKPLVPIVSDAPPRILTPYERHLSMSRARGKQRGGWKVRG